MEKIRLSKRLEIAADYVKEELPIADIGSDHAYLPIYLLQKNIIPSAIAGEVVNGPFENAQQKVKSLGLEEKISVRLGSGLNVLAKEDKIGTVTICGMGGNLITEILTEGLERSNLPLDARLVLQPNNKETNLRIFLQNNNYKIIDETIIEENDKNYEFIVAEHQTNPVVYSEKELLFGPKLIKDKSVLFYKKWTEKLMLQKSIVEEVKKSNNPEKLEELQKKQEKIEEVLL